MLFVSILLMVTGYTMIYSALHGRWEFWKYFFPATSVPAPGAAPAAPASTASKTA